MTRIAFARQRTWTLALTIIACFVVESPGQESATDAKPAPTWQYNADIRPILADTCFACHGPDSAARKADLRLDQRQTAVDMGAIVPGDPDGSEMLRRILSEDPEERMPPAATKKKLTDEQLQRLTEWIGQGAEYQLHWSLIPPASPPLPDVRDPSWVSNPIDRFILARMDAAGLAPAPPADRRTLARRVSLDLIGLPPRPEQVERFVNDTRSDAYEQYVDELLRSPHWGEHRGRYWLDYARYADTHGIHFDNYREMWSYRDWVIAAFNQNMPFDQFTIENLAGDLLPGATLDQRIASGFNRCNMTTNEGGIIDEEYLVLYTRDRMETTSSVWLGLTANCAVCHNHKFDPLSQREFYEMAAFFNNTMQAARDGNVKDTPPIIVVPSAADRVGWQELPDRMAQAEQALNERRSEARPDFDQWLASANRESFGPVVPADQLHFQAPLTEGSGAVVHASLDGQPIEAPLSDSARWDEPSAGQRGLRVQGSACELAAVGDFDAEQPFTCTAWIHVPANDGYGAICARMDSAANYRGWDFWMQQRRVGLHLVQAWPDQALKVVGRDQVPADRWVHVAVSYDGQSKAAGVKVYYDGQPQEVNVENDRLTGSTQTGVPFRIGQRSGGEAFSGGVRDVRIYRRALDAGEVAGLAKSSRVAELLARSPAERGEQETQELFEFWLDSQDQVFRDRRQQLAALQQDQEQLKTRGTIGHVMQDRAEPAMAFVLFRGEYDKRRDEVQPDTPDVLPAFGPSRPRNRLGFAEWLLLPEHPLTARVTVNRCWQEVFGTGIVKTAGDFGVSGDLPSHPELLDWLAVEFRESGWDLKRLYKLIVMSSTYRQSAAVTPATLERDPDNRLLARGPRYRMDAEMVRDYALAVSQLLVPTIGGPSVKPYQPPGVWEAIAMNVSNTRAYTQDQGENLYRRSLYTFVKRMAPPASMELFNAPNREYCVVRRERTNTPLQALVTLNDPQFVEAARHLAQNTLRSDGLDCNQRLQWLAVKLLAREFRADELPLVRQSLDDLLLHYQNHPDDTRALLDVGDSPADATLDPGELAGWTMLANQLLNLDEVLNK